MKKILSTLLIALIAQFSIFATNHVVNTQGMTFSPSVLTINSGDSVTFNNTGGAHNVNGTIATFPQNPSSFSNPSGVSNGWSYVHVFTTPGLYNYQCDPHLPGMVGSITVNPPTDCDGIVNGIAALDSCGTCHKSYVYAGMGVLNYVDTYADTLNFQGMFILAGSPMDQQFNPNWINDPNSCSNTIYDLVSNSSDHTTLKAAIDACSLDGTLSGSGPFTLFAPTDAAFNLLPAGTVTALLNNIPQLTDILLHHVVGDSVMSGMLSNNQIVTTLLGTDITVTINTNGVFIDNAQVTLADLIADNGVVHVIDAVLLPTQSSTVYDIVSNSSNHTTLKTAIDACSFDGYLSAAGPHTLFAPTDAAFNLLPAGTVAALLNDIPQLTNILKHHVVGDSVISGMLSNNQIVTTLLGTDITVTINANGIFIDNAQVILADLIADNGVVHVIDAVLLPPSPSNTIYDIVSYSSDHTTLKTAINACSLDGTLSGPGPFTLFAPTDAAFDLLPAGTVAALLNDIPQLTDILLHHVVADSVVSGMLSNGQTVNTLNGNVTVTTQMNMVYIDNAMVTVANITADNGVVHVIDAVLLPNSTSIFENMTEIEANQYLYSINILGDKISKYTKNQVIFDIYKNGSVIKRLNK